MPNLKPLVTTMIAVVGYQESTLKALTTGSDLTMDTTCPIEIKLASSDIFKLLLFYFTYIVFALYFQQQC